MTKAHLFCLIPTPVGARLCRPNESDPMIVGAGGIGTGLCWVDTVYWGRAYTLLLTKGSDTTQKGV